MIVGIGICLPDRKEIRYKAWWKIRLFYNLINCKIWQGRWLLKE
jgi:hypothetical protein